MHSPNNHSQRGVIAQMWLVAGAAVAVSVAVAVAVSAVRTYNARLDQAGYDRGVSETAARYSARDNAALQAAIGAQKIAMERLAAAEAKAASVSASVDAQYQRGVKDGKANTDRLVAAARSGALQLRDHGTIANCPTGGSAAVPSATASATSGNGTAGSNLSAKSSEFLLSISGEADEVVKQLAAAQAVILSDREACK